MNLSEDYLKNLILTQSNTLNYLLDLAESNNSFLMSILSSTITSSSNQNNSSDIPKTLKIIEKNNNIKKELLSLKKTLEKLYFSPNESEYNITYTKIVNIEFEVKEIQNLAFNLTTKPSSNDDPFKKVIENVQNLISAKHTEKVNNVNTVSDNPTTNDTNLIINKKEENKSNTIEKQDIDIKNSENNNTLNITTINELSTNENSSINKEIDFKKIINTKSNLKNSNLTIEKLITNISKKYSLNILHDYNKSTKKNISADKDILNSVVNNIVINLTNNTPKPKIEEITSSKNIDTFNDILTSISNDSDINTNPGKIESFKDKISNDIKERTDSIKEKITSSDNKEKIEELKNKIGNDIKESTTSIKEKITSSDNKEKIEELKNKISTDIKDGTTSIKEKITSSDNKEKIDTLKNKISTDVKESTTSIKEKITSSDNKEKIDTLKNKISTNFKESTTSIKEKITSSDNKEKIEALKNKISNEIKEKSNSIKNIINKNTKEIPDSPENLELHEKNDTISNKFNDIKKGTIETEFNTNTKTTTTNKNINYRNDIKNKKLQELSTSLDALKEFYADAIKKDPDFATLIISEKTGLITLPYTKETLKLSKFKNFSISRFREAYKLAKFRANKSTYEALTLANELMFRYDLHPAIIAACQNMDELDIYISCLDTNSIEEFPFFEIKFESSPIKTKKH